MVQAANGLERGEVNYHIARVSNAEHAPFESEFLRAVVDAIMLVAGDSDFQPCIAQLVLGRPELHICVCAAERSVRAEYRRQRVRAARTTKTM